MKYRYTIPILLLFFLTFSSIASAGEVTATRSIVDSRGVTVELPAKITKVAPLIGAFAQITAMLGDADKIVNAAPRIPKMFFKIFPQVQSSDNTTQSGSSPFSVESIIASGAQIAYGPIGNFFSNAQIRQLNEAGVTVVVLDRFSTAEELQQTILSIGEMLGGNAVIRAKEFVSYFNDNINRVSGMMQGAKRVRVLSLSHRSGSYTTVNNDDIGSSYMQVAGGENVAAHYDVGGSGIMQIVNTEQVLLWDPDIIITNDAASKKTIAGDPALQSLKAVQAGKIFVVPAGVYLWSVRSAEGALQPLWLATILHPERSQDIDMKKELRNFYHLFYQYDLNDEEIADILQGNAGHGLAR